MIPPEVIRAQAEHLRDVARWILPENARISIHEASIMLETLAEENEKLRKQRDEALEFLTIFRSMSE